ncbi:hypothetical protein [Edaphobacter bradus]|uniref:hypothetical protein n=1 Tax=Edaphobacter bradus TaxID=2259016 RepID=UPI0021E0FA05|nr:hypothetical protein [Edaphobacter bradus]
MGKKRFHVIGCKDPKCLFPAVLGEFDSAEEAEKFRKSAELMGWLRTAVHDRHLNQIVEADQSLASKPKKKTREDVN